MCLQQSIVQRVKNARTILERFELMLQEKISSRRSIVPGNESGKREARDLFTRLLQANTTDAGLPLDDHELMGNTFAFLFAGHGIYFPCSMSVVTYFLSSETTASTISITLALLALKPEEQERAHKAVQAVTHGNTDPVSVSFYRRNRRVLNRFDQRIWRISTTYSLSKPAAMRRFVSIVCISTLFQTSSLTRFSGGFHSCP